MAEVQTVSIVVAASSVVAGVAFAVLQLRDFVRTRQTDLVMRLDSTFGSREFQEAWVETLRMEFKDYDDFLKKYGATSAKPAFISVNMVVAFFEGVGLLLRRRFIDISLIDDLHSTDIILTWHKVKPIVDGWREQFNRPQMAEWFEYLYDEMQKREQELAKAQ